MLSVWRELKSKHRLRELGFSSGSGEQVFFSLMYSSTSVCFPTGTVTQLCLYWARENSSRSSTCFLLNYMLRAFQESFSRVHWIPLAFPTYARSHVAFLYEMELHETILNMDKQTDEELTVLLHFVHTLDRSSAGFTCHATPVGTTQLLLASNFVFFSWAVSCQITNVSSCLCKFLWI